MKKDDSYRICLLKLTALVISVFAVLMLALLSLGKVSASKFWAFVIAAGFFAYVVIPYIKRREKTSKG